MKKHFTAILAVALLSVVFLRADNPHVPRGATIVADVSVSGQTSAQSITLFTPTADATFRVSIYMEMFGTTSNTTFLDALMSWTDDLVFEHFNGTPPTGAPGIVACSIGTNQAVCSSTNVIRAKSGDPISLDIGTNGFALPSGGSYTAYALVEQTLASEENSFEVDRVSRWSYNEASSV